MYVILYKGENTMAKKSSLIKTFDELPWLLKIILCIPALDIVWAIYRIVKGVTENNMTLVVIGIIWIIGACSITWIIDLISVIIYKHPILA